MGKENKILVSLRECTHRVFPAKEGEVFIFGSRANGCARSESDWDVLIITDDRIEKDYEKHAFPFAEIGWYFDQQITPLHYSRSEWEKEVNTAFYHNVMREAIQL